MTLKWFQNTTQRKKSDAVLLDDLHLHDENSRRELIVEGGCLVFPDLGGCFFGIEDIRV